MNLDPETSNDISQTVKNIFKVMATVSCQCKVMFICLVHYSLFLSIPVQEPLNSNLSLRYHCIVKLTTGDNGKQNKQETSHSICARIFKGCVVFSEAYKEAREKFKQRIKYCPRLLMLYPSNKGRFVRLL